MQEKKIPRLTDVYEVDESLIRTSAALSGNDNSFVTILSLGDEYREAGLTPVYYCCDKTKTIYVTTKEKIDRKYH